MKKYLLLALSFFLMISNTNFQKPSPRPGKDYALFFAIDDYSGTTGFSSLKNPGKDADAIAAELKTMYGFETKVYKNYTKAQIYQVLESWQKKTFAEDAQLFIFFSGHGTFWEFTKKGYFVPKGSPNDYSAYIELTDLGNIVTQIPCKHILLAIDACYSGTIDQAIAFKGDAPTFRRPGDVATSERDNLIYRQLRNPSRLLLTSGGKERTPDGANNSPFAAAILKGLRGAYTYGDGLFTYADLLSALERVNPTPHQGELPGHEQGGFVFVSQSQPAPATSATTQPPRTVEPPKPTIPDDFVLVKGGTFQMGDQFGDGDADEKPVHSVAVSDFYMGKYEVTVGEYLAFVNATGQHQPEWMETGNKFNLKTGDNNFYNKFGDALTNVSNPIIGVKWYNTLHYCNWLSSKRGLQRVYAINGNNIEVEWNANGYRLPTEAEWEYAARSGGKKEKWSGCSNEKKLTLYANYGESGIKDKSQYMTKVGSCQPNGIGLYDMSGNVSEWCWDWYYVQSYIFTTNNDNPRGPENGKSRVIRGGSYYFNSSSCRVSNRDFSDPSYGYGTGFRLVRH